MQILVGRFLYTGTGSTLKMSYLAYFFYYFWDGCVVNKRWHYSAGRTVVHMFHGHYRTQDWVVRILDRWNFCARKTLFPVNNAHLTALLGFTYSVHRALNNSENVLFGVFCFPDVYAFGSRMLHDLVHILFRGPLCREKQITRKPCSLPGFSLSCCMGGGVKLDLASNARGESLHILDKFHWCVMEASFLVHNV